MRLRAVVLGDVQGVGFRWFVVDRARPLGLTGWVRNLPDGSVEVTAEGDRDRLDSLVEALRHGPHSAHVTAVRSSLSQALGNLGPFEITD